MRNINYDKKNHFWNEFFYRYCLFVVVSVLLILVSCSKSKTCTSQISFNGKTYIGIGKNKEIAKRNSCNKYCLDVDPQCEAMYRIWLDSPKGRAAGSLPKEKAIYKEKRLLDCVTIRCADECMKKLDAAKLIFEVKCK